MRLGIRFQLTSVSVGLSFFTALVLTASSTLILRRTMATQIHERTAQLAAVINGELELRKRELEHTVDLYSKSEQFRLHVSNESWPDVTTTLEGIVKSKIASGAMVFDSEGQIQAVGGIVQAKAAAFGATHARQGVEAEHPQSLIEPVDQAVYVIATQKLNYFGRTIGELLLVQSFTDELAVDIHNKIGPEVTIFGQGGPRASSVPPTPQLGAALKAAWPNLGKEPLTTLGTITMRDTSYFTMAFPLPVSPKAALKPTDNLLIAIAYAIPETEIAIAQRRTLLGSVGLSIVFSIISVILGLTLANQIARPIAAMADQFSRISASGDLSLRVSETSGNEIGDMARSFNAMQQRVEQLHGRVVMAEERMRKELQMASTVQEMLFQQEMPHNRACEVAAYTSTLVETSGDWYAVFDDKESKRTIFVIADATGHGASAALLTAITHGFFQTMWTAKQGGDAALSRIPPSTILSMLNSVVLNSAHGTITATVFVGVLHHGTRKMVYASAGHIPPIVTRWVNNEMKANILTCNPSSSIGSSEKPVYEDYTVELPADALVLVYTDGLTEVEDPKGLQWGVRKLIQVLRGCQTDTVESVRQKVLDSCMAFAKGKELQDDMTYLTIRIL